MTALNSTVICVSSVIWNEIGMILSCCSHHIFLQKMITCYLEPSFFTQNIPFLSFANKTWFYLKERENSWWPIFWITNSSHIKGGKEEWCICTICTENSQQIENVFQYFPGVWISFHWTLFLVINNYKRHLILFRITNGYFPIFRICRCNTWYD